MAGESAHQIWAEGLAALDAALRALEAKGRRRDRRAHPHRTLVARCRCGERGACLAAMPNDYIYVDSGPGLSRAADPWGSSGPRRRGPAQKQGRRVLPICYRFLRPDVPKRPQRRTALAQPSSLEPSLELELELTGSVDTVINQTGSTPLLRTSWGLQSAAASCCDAFACHDRTSRHLDASPRAGTPAGRLSRAAIQSCCRLIATMNLCSFVLRCARRRRRLADLPVYHGERGRDRAG